MEIKLEPESQTKHHNGASEDKSDEQRNGYSEKKHKDKHKHKDKKHKHHKHDKDKDRDKDRHHSRDKDKDRDKHRSSSNHSSTEKSHKSDRHDRDKLEKDKSLDKSKSRSEVSSSPSKDSSNSKHKSKHKDKHQDKDKDRSKSSSSSSSSKPREKEVKAEPISPVKSIAPLIVDSDDDDTPLSVKMKQNQVENAVKKEIKKEESESEDDLPLIDRYENDFTLNSRDSSLSLEDSTLTMNSESEDEDFKSPPDSSKRSARKKASVEIKKRKAESESDEDIPLSRRKKVKTEPAVKKRKRSPSDDDYEDDSDYDRKKKPKGKAPKRNTSASSKNKKSPSQSPTKKRKGKEEEEQEVWKWWEEAPRDDGVKWNFLQHKGPVFAPGYERLPKSVVFRYNGKPMRLSQDAEEVAGFYSRFIEHDYTTKEKFNTNFFKDWRKQMNKEEREIITDLKKCDFAEINEHYKLKSEERKQMTKEQKLVIKEENEEMQKEYGVCILDGHKEKIGNFKIEPPGLFRGRGDHPKMGMLKKRVVPEDVIINCSKDAKAPTPPAGHKWKEVRHDNTVTWLACWIENVQGQTKYVMLNPTSRLKGEKDWMKYEKARELAKHIDKIRENYKREFKSKEMRVRQRAVALYFIDKLALRAGNEKDEDQADTVGCCSLRHEHIKLHDEKDGKECVVVFDFLGKDSIRYYNEVPVEKRVYKNLKIFMENKKPGDDLFDRLNTAILNKHLNELMNGLTAKVFRTYNASHTLQQQLDELTPSKGTVAEKVLAYNRANRAVAILCNHQRAVPKTHEKSMENLDIKIKTKRDEVKKVRKELKDMRKGTKDHEKKKAQLVRLEDQLKRLEMNKTDKEEGKEIALGTSKLNYLDPRITVSWCKKWEVPVEKVYNKTQRAKFRWAIDMADKHYRFD